jgi:glucose/mannose-6-phosphate isomerase
MDLNDTQTFERIDTQNMLAEIDNLPDQLEQAWKLSRYQPLPAWDGIRQVIIAGMGGSAIGADLLSAYTTPACHVPLVVQRNYDLPAWARGPETLVIASSHSGNTEETLSVFEQAVHNGCRTVAVSRGGQLRVAAEQASAPFWQFEHNGQPRAAVGYSFGLLLGLLHRLGLIPDPTDEVQAAVERMCAQQISLRATTPDVSNPAKRMAGQLYGRYVVVFGADALEPVARRWKGQLNEVAKAGAAFEFLPEADHNTLAGVTNPDEVLAKVFTLFLRAPSYHPRNRLRADLTKQVFMLEGINTDFIDASGSTRLEQQWTALHMGDYTAYYLAMAYQVDPTPVDAIESLKAEMANAAGT